MAIACSCHVVRDADVRSAIRDGARSVEDVMDTCAAGTNCGGCVPTIRMLLAAELALEGSAAGSMTAA